MPGVAPSSLGGGEGPILVGVLPDRSEMADGVGCCICCCLCVAQLLLGHDISSHGSDFTVEISPSLCCTETGMPGRVDLVVANIDAAGFFTIIMGGGVIKVKTL